MNQIQSMMANMQKFTDYTMKSSAQLHAQNSNYYSILEQYSQAVGELFNSTGRYFQAIGGVYNSMSQLENLMNKVFQG